MDAPSPLSADQAEELLDLVHTLTVSNALLIAERDFWLNRAIQAEVENYLASMETPYGPPQEGRRAA